MITGTDVLALGVPQGPAVGEALALARARSAAGESDDAVRARIAALLAAAERGDPAPGAPLAGTAELEDAFLRALRRARVGPAPALRGAPRAYRVYGDALIDAAARAQMDTAMRLPVAVAGALMPDAHLGYGLPIGGVLATEAQVIPWAVGVDIGCSVQLSIFALPADALARERIVDAVVGETVFGAGRARTPRAEHAVLDDPLWEEHPLLARRPDLRDLAAAQLGTSGGGNHFVEVGIYRPEGGAESDARLAVLSHSGSRGFGARVADHYSELAAKRRPELPGDARKLAWLELADEDGDAYWRAMQLAGRYALANHEVIHDAVAARLGIEGALEERVANSHNLAWLEPHEDRELVVHRKGATPAAAGQRGIIPGDMITGALLVRGRGDADSLASASHGAGRVMSRTRARRTIAMGAVRADLAARGLTLIGSAADEAPAVYKDLAAVMDAQRDLVRTEGRFEPRVIRMADG